MSALNQDLIRMIIRGDANAVKTLMEQEADANTTGGLTALGASNTALMWAATEGYLDIVHQLLVSRWAGLNVK